jgi:hypothetical protein
LAFFIAARRNRWLRNPAARPKAFHDKTDQNTVQALDRGCRFCPMLAAHPGLTLSEIAEGTGEAVATVFRALVTLQGHGMVEVEEPGQFWHIGPGAFRTGTAFLRRTKVVERARQPMDALMRDTGETANLGIEVPRWIASTTSMPEITADDGVLAVKELARGEHDEELAVGAVGIGRARHADDAALERDVGELGRDVGQGPIRPSPPSTGSPLPCRIARRRSGP